VCRRYWSPICLTPHFIDLTVNSNFPSRTGVPIPAVAGSRAGGLVVPPRAPPATASGEGEDFVLSPEPTTPTAARSPHPPQRNTKPPRIDRKMMRPVRDFFGGGPG
jgi:hypothetical protein